MTEKPAISQDQPVAVGPGRLVLAYALLAAAFGYIAVAWVAGAGALAIAAYAVKSRFMTKRS